ncbi:MAG: helix-turn-helix transcriptional regulator [Gemmatimonadota bacterium]|nr:helix-turn-helix transcriptional regulator [Gemmatimonadota bacterium]
MLPIELQAPQDIARVLARRVKVLRLDRGWTQRELAERAGVALATYRRFERTGRISLERLLRLALVLDALGGFHQLFVRPPAQSLEEMERRVERPGRQRGRRGDA